tara:strand:- start:1082 stop:1333 length:252 start_codon:yes stop_codon:yes gene_type:complete
MPNLRDMPPLSAPREEDMIDGMVDEEYDLLTQEDNAPLFRDSDIPYHFPKVEKCTKTCCEYFQFTINSFEEFSDYVLQNKLIF